MFKHYESNVDDQDQQKKEFRIQGTTSNKDEEIENSLVVKRVKYQITTLSTNPGNMCTFSVQGSQINGRSKDTLQFGIHSVSENSKKVQLTSISSATGNN